MARYLLRFRVETCLKHKADLTLSHAGETAVFLFSTQSLDNRHVIVQVELDAKKYDDAWGTAAGVVLPPVLDALSFATGTPLLLRDLELALKEESGKPERRGLFVGHIRFASAVPLEELEIQEVNKILSAGEDLRLPLCWHRYALDRELALEQFVFHWLAFEALAGDTDVSSRCPKCAQELTHCELPVRHRGSSKTAARKIFQAAHPDVKQKEFDDKIWNKARNYVFHGRRYPDPKHLAALLDHAKQLHTAVDREIDELLGFGNRPRTHRRYDTLRRRFIFFEWTTKSPSAPFATDWPASHLAKMAAEEDPNGPAHQAAMGGALKLLDPQEFENW